MSVGTACLLLLIIAMTTDIVKWFFQIKGDKSSFNFFFKHGFKFEIGWCHWYFCSTNNSKREYKFSLKVKLLKLGIGCFVLVQYTIKGTKKGQKI